MRTVYVAAASSELDRARRAMDFVRGCPGLELAQDWVADIEREGSTNPSNPAGAFRYATRDLLAVSTSRILWLLLPHHGNRTIGAWVELGTFLACRLPAPDGLLVVSGPMPERSIFISLADVWFEADEAARTTLAGLAAAQLPSIPSTQETP